jgi:hypothetical protein
MVLSFSGDAIFNPADLVASFASRGRLVPLHPDQKPTRLCFARDRTGALGDIVQQAEATSSVSG